MAKLVQTKIPFGAIATWNTGWIVAFCCFSLMRFHRGYFFHFRNTQLFHFYVRDEYYPRGAS